MTVWIDADSCPVILRTFLEERAKKSGFALSLVANREIKKREEHKHIKMIVCSKEKGAADDFLVENAKENDIVVTRDIPLAARLLEKNICTLNDRGTIFDKDSIEDRLKMREFSMNLSALGFSGSEKSFYGKKELDSFKQSFEFALSRRIFL